MPGLKVVGRSSAYSVSGTIDGAIVLAEELVIRRVQSARTINTSYRRVQEYRERANLVSIDPPSTAHVLFSLH
jgi:hypothetical protein